MNSNDQFGVKISGMTLGEKKPSDRLLIIESFIKDPPDSDFQRGYLCALMDEAAEDIEDAGSDIFEQMLKICKKLRWMNVENWRRRRAITLG